MLEAVKMPRISLTYDHCDDVIIGNLVNALKAKFKNVTIIINSAQEKADDDDERVNIFDTDFWKDTTPGDLLMGTRLKHELTQMQLARLSGISHATISAYERNKRPLSKLAAARLANAMGEDPSCFFDHIVEK